MKPSKHFYKRESLKPDARRDVRKTKIKERLDVFERFKKKALKEFEKTQDFSSFNFDSQNLADKADIEGIYSQKEYNKRLAFFKLRNKILEAIQTTKYNAELLGNLVGTFEDLDESTEAIDPSLKDLVKDEDIAALRDLKGTDAGKRGVDFLKRFARRRGYNIKDKIPPGSVATQATQEVNAFATRVQNEAQSAAADFVRASEEAMDEVFDILTEPLTFPSDIGNEVDDPYVPNTKEIYNSKDDKKAQGNGFESPYEGETKPEKNIAPILGLGIGYLKALPGHAFAGGETYVIRPMTTIRYNLKVDKEAESRGTLEVKTPWSVGLSAILGKRINPYVGLYTKAGMEFAGVNFTYNVIDDVRFPDTKKNTHQEKYSLTLKPVFAGFGGMIFGDKWIIAAEYNVLNFAKTDIRKYDDPGDDQRYRGYAYSGVHHRVMLRLFYIHAN